VADAHAAGLRVHAWTVDDARAARRLIRAGVDGLFTNDPARLRQALRRRA
jgi:glycerophosphoryl diester phosphodiesterase